MPNKPGVLSEFVSERGESLEEFLYRQYVVEKRSLMTVAQALGVSCSTVRHHMKRFDIPIRTPKEAGRLATGTRNPMYEKCRSAEHRRKLSEAQKRRFAQGSRQWNTGKRLTPDHRRKISRANRGASNRRWRGGRIVTTHGYIAVYVPSHPYPIRGSYVYEHRLVMEQHLGRYLRPEEVVHHINGDHADNRLENLRLFHGPSAHAAFHARERAKAKRQNVGS